MEKGRGGGAGDKVNELQNPSDKSDLSIFKTEHSPLWAEMPEK